MARQHPNPERLTSIDSTKLVADDLIGIDVIDPDGAPLGTIADFVVNGGGQIEAIEMESGGLMGLVTNRVTVKIDRLDLLADPYDKYYLRVTKPISGATDETGVRKRDTPDHPPVNG